MRIVKPITALLTIAYVCTDSGYAQTSNNCGLEKFRCHNGQCIQSDLLCDGTVQCDDGSDETEAECQKPEILCPDYAFRCKYGGCVNRNALCNGVQDCADNSDETHSQCKAAGPSNQTELCRVDEFTCSNGQCVPSIALCDGIRNCADGSDEIIENCGSMTCAATVFRCDYGACIDGDLRCNGVADCADRSDENPQICGGTTWSPLATVTPTRPTRRPPTRPTSRPPPSRPASNDKCRAPPQPENGHWKLHRSQCPSNEDCDIAEGEELDLGSHIVYSCNLGYRLRGLADVSCTYQGKWLTIPICTEIRCKGLSTPSTEARCTYNDEWVPCESPVLPRTTARLFCRNSYRRESTLLSTRRDIVKCNTNGQWEPEPIRCVPECGIPPADVTPLVINGVQPNITEFPWHASLYRDYPDEPKKFFCGSSIITENLLITAAHCVYDENSRRIDTNKIYVVTGNLFRDYDSPLHDQRFVRKNTVKNIFITCNYLGLIGNYIWDIAILQLEEPFVLSSWLVPICIDDSSDQAVLQAGTYGKVAGFGRTAAGEASGILQALKVPYIPLNQCKSASQGAHTEQYLTTDKFCAGYTNGSSVCDGDSGGGLVFKTGSLWYLRGIVSVSLGTIKEGGQIRCDNNLYSLYTQISSHIAWIQEVISSIERNIPYSSCPNRPR